MTDRRVDAIFQPASIAVYGASRDERKLGHTLLRNALGGGFDGRVVAVNPAGGEVLDLPTVAGLREPVDLALVSVPAASVLEVDVNPIPVPVRHGCPVVVDALVVRR